MSLKQCRGRFTGQWPRERQEELRRLTDVRDEGSGFRLGRLLLTANAALGPMRQNRGSFDLPQDPVPGPGLPQRLRRLSVWTRCKPGIDPGAIQHPGAAMHRPG